MASRKQSGIVKRNYRIFYPLPLTMATVTLSSLIVRVRSSKLSIPLCSQAPPRLARCPFLLNAFPESIIFRPRLTELLMLCCVTIRSRQIQQQMPCLVGLRERLFELHVSEPRSHVSEPHSHVPEPHPPGSTLLGPILSALYTFSARPDPRLRNIRLVLATSVVRRVSKQASWRTYKNNVSSMKLGCRAIEIGA